jgi:hypothetical protein
MHDEDADGLSNLFSFIDPLSISALTTPSGQIQLIHHSLIPQCNQHNKTPFPLSRKNKKIRGLRFFS